MDGKRPFDRRTVADLVEKKDWESLRMFDFRGADLCGFDFRCADLRGVDFAGADLSLACFSGACLDHVGFNGAYLDSTRFNWASLSHTDFTKASLLNSSFWRSTLSNVDFAGADITNADFDGTVMREIIMDEMTSHYKSRCPETGSFIAFKKAYNADAVNIYPFRIVELCIPAHALRSSGTTNKCRCSEAEVLAVTRLDGSEDPAGAAVSMYDVSFLYEVGKTVKVDGFDVNRWHECASGIHFFMTRKEAMAYSFC